MLIIKKEKDDNIERMLKRYKRKFDRTQIMKRLREKQQYMKPSVRRRKQVEKAKYIQKKYRTE